MHWLSANFRIVMCILCIFLGIFRHISSSVCEAGVTKSLVATHKYWAPPYNTWPWCVCVCVCVCVHVRVKLLRGEGCVDVIVQWVTSMEES